MIVSFYYYIDKKHNFRKCKEIIYFIVFSYMISLQFNIFLKISQGSTVTYFIKTKYFGKTNFKIIKKCCVTEHLCNTASFFLTIYFMRSIHRITLFALFDLWIHRIGQDHVDKIGGNYFLHHARRHFRRNSLLITFYKHRQNALTISSFVCADFSACIPIAITPIGHNGRTHRVILFVVYAMNLL